MLIQSAARRVAIVGGTRIPFARSYGAYAGQGNQELLVAALRALVDRYRLQGQRLGDVIGGAVIKHSRDFNLVRESLMSAGLDPQTPGLDIQRACGTGLEAAILVANKIALGQIEAGIACGVDTVSDPPVVFSNSFRELLLKSYSGRSFGQRLAPWLKLRPRDLKPILPGIVEPRTGLSMGQSCELMAKTWSITRADQDRVAVDSHRKAAAAWQAGFYDDLVVPHAGLQRDNNVRADASMEKLATLRPVFDTSGAGTLTAGNSTPLTDGAAAVLLASEDWARERRAAGAGIPARRQELGGRLRQRQGGPADGARLRHVCDARRRPALAPGLRLLRDPRGLRRADAVHAQGLGVRGILPRTLGRSAPLGAIAGARSTSRAAASRSDTRSPPPAARILAALAKLLNADPQSRRGLISVCTAGGMGVTAIVERA